MEEINSIEVKRKKISDIFAFGIHEFILLLVIVLNFLGFFHLLPSEVDFVEKIISWTILGLILHKANLSDIFFGDKNKLIDVSIILCYFGLIAKDLVEFSLTAIDDAPNSAFAFMYSFIIDNADFFVRSSFMLSSILLILLALYITFKVEFKIPSVMHIIHEDGRASKNILKLMERFVLTNVVLFGFYVIVFNLIAEWLTIAVDDPLLLLGILFYFFKARKLTMGTKIEKLGSMGEDFYEKFVEMFKSQKKIFLALTGMLVLHILTDIANFILPYTIGISSTLYSRLGEGHTAIIELAKSMIAINPGLFSSFNITVGYIINIIGITLLMCSSGIIWYHLFQEKPLKFGSVFMFIFFFTVSYFFMNPAFSIGRIDQSFNVLGTDIQSQEIQINPVFFVISLAIGAILAGLDSVKKTKKIISMLFALISTGFFIYYLFYYSTSIAQYYITFFMNATDIFLMIILGLFGLITAVFYFIGIITFLIETWS